MWSPPSPARARSKTRRWRRRRTMTTETQPQPAATPEPIAPDGSVTAIRTSAFGGLNISWDKIIRTVPIYLGLIVIWIYFDTQTGNLFTGSRNLSEMAQEFSYEAVLAIGVVFVLLLGEIDLSLGYLTLLSVAICSSFSELNGRPAGAAILAAIAICTVCGLFQGFLIAWVRMPSFVVTLGGFLIFEGIAFHILGGATINVFDWFIDSLGTYYLASGLSWAIAAGVVAVFVFSSLAKYRARARAGLPPVPMV